MKTNKLIVTILGIYHLQYKKNINCGVHGFTSPMVSQAGSNMQKSNFFRNVLYFPSSTHVKKNNCVVMLSRMISINIVKFIAFCRANKSKNALIFLKECSFLLSYMYIFEKINWIIITSMKPSTQIVKFMVEPI